MTNKEAMATPGQHTSSVKIKKLIEQGKKITNLQTNGKSGDQGVSVVEFDNLLVYVVDNGSCDRDDTNNFGLTVRKLKELEVL